MSYVQQNYVNNDFIWKYNDPFSRYSVDSRMSSAPHKYIRFYLLNPLNYLSHLTAQNNPSLWNTPVWKPKGVNSKDFDTYLYSHFNRCFPFFSARYASKIWAFPNQMNIVTFLSSGIAKQQRIACDNVSALLFYGLSNLRYYKQNNANFKYKNDTFKFWTSILSPISRRKMKFSINFAAMLNLVRQIKSSLNRNPPLELLDITHA